LRAEAAQLPLCFDELAAMIPQFAAGAAILVADDPQRLQFAVPRCQDIERRLALEIRATGPPTGFRHACVERLNRPFEIAGLVTGGLPGTQMVASLGGAVPGVKRIVDFNSLGVAETFQQFAPVLTLRTQIPLYALESCTQLGQPAPPQPDAAARAVPAFQLGHASQGLPMTLRVIDDARSGLRRPFVRRFGQVF
jgi:hypothetical protein